MSVVREWLESLYGRSPGYFTVIGFAGGRPVATKWFATSDLARAARTIEASADRLDVYVSCATHAEPSARGRGNAKTVTSIPGLWSDLDIGTSGHKAAALPNPSSEAEALAILEGLPDPSAVIHSGGGLQVWWFFDQPWTFTDPAEAARVSDGWQRLLVERGQARGLHVDAVGDLPRILRVPGTQNRKLPEGARPVVARHLQGPVYPAAELASLGASTVGHSDKNADVEVGPLGTWAEILEPHGWTQAGTRPTDGATLWVRPGKSASEGHSAVSDPYGLPVLVNFSASAGLPTGPGQRLTKFRVWAYLCYGGDEKAAKDALARITRETPARMAELADRFASAHIDWESFWTEVDPEPDWLCEPLIERGRQIACYSEAKAGKSLLWLEVCAALASGRPVLGNAARSPVIVVYVDQENMRVDIRERLGKLGYEGQSLDNLHYYCFPNLSYLDTEAGGRELFALAQWHRADLVIIDTLSRVVEGDENENNTYHSFYRHTGVRLKAAGIALVRLDHSGKDQSRGMRGASSKTTDVDEIWQLTADDGGAVTLVRTHSRSNHGAGRVPLLRKDNPLRHEAGRNYLHTPDDGEAAEVFLDLQGIAPGAGGNAAWEDVKADAIEQGYTQATIRAAQARRKARSVHLES